MQQSNVRPKPGLIKQWYFQVTLLASHVLWENHLNKGLLLMDKILRQLSMVVSPVFLGSQPLYLITAGYSLSTGWPCLPLHCQKGTFGSVQSVVPREEYMLLPPKHNNNSGWYWPKVEVRAVSSIVEIHVSAPPGQIEWLLHPGLGNGPPLSQMTIARLLQVNLSFESPWV